MERRDSPADRRAERGPAEHIGWEVLTWNREAQAFYRAIGGAEEQVLSFSMGPRQIRDLARCFPSKH